MQKNNSQVAAERAAGASAGGLATERPALKAKEIVEVERVPEGVLLRRKIVVVDAKTERVIRELCLPCDDPLHEEFGLGGPDCVCEKYIGTVDEIVLPPDADVDDY